VNEPAAIVALHFGEYSSYMLDRKNEDKVVMHDRSELEGICAHMEFSRRVNTIAQFEAKSAAMTELRLLANGCWMESKNTSQPRFGSLAPDDWHRAWAQVVDVEQSVHGLHYHLRNVERIERKLDRLLRRFRGRTRAAENDGGMFSWDQTNTMTFEFQAYVSLVHRHLAYLAWLLGTLLGVRECPYLTTVKKLLIRKTEGPYVDLLGVLDANRSWLEALYIGKDSGHKSLRNELTHDSFVPVGGLHVRDGTAHVRGQISSEMNRVESEFRVYRPGEEMRRQLARLEQFLFEVCKILDSSFVPDPEIRRQMRKNMGSKTGEFGSVAS
jgi:hypothetical protein